MTHQPGLPRYGDASDCPPLVRAAVERAREVGAEKACLPEVGRLLRTLAASRPAGARLGETGSGAGVGAAWMASALPAGATLVTVELDPKLAAAASEVLAGVERVTVLAGDWSAIRAHAPFDLLFADHGVDKSNPPLILELVAPGGLVVLDDLTPEGVWDEELRAAFPGGDPVRQAWLDRKDVVATEVLVTATEAVLLAARRGSL